MSLFDALRRRRIRKDAFTADLSAELESYVEMLTAENVAKGMSPADAKRAALIKLGGYDQVAENVRDVRRGGSNRVSSALLDVRQAWRTLRRSPAITAVIVATLAITIGADTAIYSIANTLLLQKLPYAEADRVVHMENPAVSLGMTATGFDFKLAKSVREAPVLESYALYYTDGGANLEGARAARLAITQVDASFMRTLGVHPALGRDFTKDESVQGRNAVIVLSDGLWHRLGASRDIIGSKMRLSGITYDVIGVMPPAVEYPNGTDAWIPLPMRNDLMGAATSPSVIARVKPGVPIADAERYVNRVYLEANREHAADIDLMTLTGLRKQLTEPIRLPIMLLFGTVTLVLLIGCANVAALLLARVSGRDMEFVVRGVMGAGTARIVRQVVTEALLLGLAGGVAGIVVARTTMQIILHVLPSDLLPVRDVHLDAHTFLYTALVAIASALLFGSAPAIRAAFASRIVPRAATITLGRGHEYFRSALVCGEIALGVLLVLCAGLLTKSLNRLENIPLGMDPAHVVTAQLRLPDARYGKPGSQLQYATSVLERVRALPGVTDAGFTSSAPFDKALGAAFGVKPEGSTNEPIFPSHATASEGYIEAQGMRVLFGRAFSDDDGRGAPVYIITESVARDLFGTGNAVGRRIMVGRRELAGEIIGVLADIRIRTVTGEARGVLFEPMQQSPTPYLSLAVRTESSNRDIAAGVRSVMNKVDADVPPFEVHMMRDVITQSLGPRGTLPRVVGMFAIVALLLCALGTYGLISEIVTRQRRAMSIRIALGARPKQLIGYVLARSLRLAGIGTIIGLLGGVAATRLLASVLFETDPLDPLVFALAPVVIGVVTILATAPPALRAAHVQVAAMLKE